LSTLRMAKDTIVGLAIAMGRILVLPQEQVITANVLYGFDG